MSPKERRLSGLKTTWRKSSDTVQDPSILHTEGSSGIDCVKIKAAAAAGASSGGCEFDEVNCNAKAHKGMRISDMEQGICPAATTTSHNNSNNTGSSSSIGCNSGCSSTLEGGNLENSSIEMQNRISTKKLIWITAIAAILPITIILIIIFSDSKAPKCKEVHLSYFNPPIRITTRLTQVTLPEALTYIRISMDHLCEDMNKYKKYKVEDNYQPKNEMNKYLHIEEKHRFESVQDKNVLECMRILRVISLLAMAPSCYRVSGWFGLETYLNYDLSRKFYFGKNRFADFVPKYGVENFRKLNMDEEKCNKYLQIYWVFMYPRGKKEINETKEQEASRLKNEAITASNMEMRNICEGLDAALA